MTMTVDELLAKQECTELVYRLARAIDRCDAGLIADCYHPDATDDHGLIKGTIAEFITGVIPMLQGMKRTQHNVTNLLVEVRGHTARGEAYFIAQHTLAGEGGEVEMFAAGRYLDRFEWREGAWKIAHRHAVYDWTMTVPASGAWDNFPPEMNFLRGQRGAGDPSYAHLAFKDGPASPPATQ